MRTRFLIGLTLLSLAASPAAQALTVVHTNDVMGEIEPCGCRTNPAGGMPRKAGFLKKLADPQLIQLDAGDLLFSTDLVPDALQAQAFVQAQYLLQAMDLTGQDAVVPGEKDFALGLDSFERLRKGAKLKFIAANLKRRNGKHFLDSHLLIKRKDESGKTVTVAVFGLVGETLAWPKDLRASPAIAAAQKEVKALRKKADYVIALTHQGLESDEKLAKAVPGIDIIIGAHSQSFLQAPALVGKTLIYQSSFRNQYVGAIKLTQPMKKENYQLPTLDAGYDSPVQTPSAVDELVKRFKVAVAEVNTREEARMQASVSLASSTDKSAVKFQTFPRCAECHMKQFDFWRKTQHSKAFETLVKASQAQNKECLSCHTVGLSDPQGFLFVNRIAEVRKSDDLTEPLSADDLNSFLKAMHEAKNLDSSVRLTAQGTPQPLRQSLNGLARSFTPVQCENCHQPGMDHPFSSGYNKAVAQETCLKCHTPDRAPAWYKGTTPAQDVIEAKRALIRCPAGELTPTE